MASFKISGVWKDSSGNITHYAFHTQTEGAITRATKTSKTEAVRLLSISGNQAMTYIWNYNRPGWADGAKVEVVDGRFLRSYHDNKVSDNLAHLIDANYFIA